LKVFAVREFVIQKKELSEPLKEDLDPQELHIEGMVEGFPGNSKQTSNH